MHKQISYSQTTSTHVASKIETRKHILIEQVKTLTDPSNVRILRLNLIGGLQDQINVGGLR